MHEANEPLQTLEPTPEVAEVSAEERSLDPHSESEGSKGEDKISAVTAPSDKTETDSNGSSSES